MFASAHFRREGVEPGCRDCPGPPGTCPTQAAAAAPAPALCCLRTARAVSVDTAKPGAGGCDCWPRLLTQPCAFLEAQSS